MSDESPVFEKIPVGAGELFTLRVDNINDFNGINVVPHFHMMDELMWFRESEGSYSIGDEKFTIKNNTLVFVPALLIHEMTLPAAASHKRYLMQFEKEWLEGYDLSPRRPLRRGRLPFRRGSRAPGAAAELVRRVQRLYRFAVSLPDAERTAARL